MPDEKVEISILEVMPCKLQFKRGFPVISNNITFSSPLDFDTLKFRVL